MATATDISILEAQKREPGTKNAARRVRVGGKIPAVVYGAGKDAAAVAVDPRQVLRILRSESGHNTIFDLALDSNRVKAMIVDWQYEPIKGTLLHVDLQRIAMDKKLTVTVPVVLKGEAAGVKTEGGILEHLLREIEIECLPADIPKSIEVDELAQARKTIEELEAELAAVKAASALFNGEVPVSPKGGARLPRH